MTKNKTHTFKLSSNLKEALRQVAFDKKVTVSKFIHDVVAKHPDVKKKLKHA